ncbi:NAD(P)H-dependent oxidoreductase [Flavobacterium azooxidireducens]|uniref:NAD(P)H-dependent oxidoreductase n=1 Tax=Flavobacterium azooxidireducens TaxID=1871076 RepID=A0ABY4KI84_9FLAO|nr:NAD(P)H-dependent oxidoreductase [Flavobacterium azooxidireducens]UPQ79403.1 NAD(P)H-dependent oxidoreductase [Flavobacterium azooxidireducens]
MSTILAFAGSNSSTSINHQLVTYLTTQLQETSFELFKLSDMDLIVYSEDEQRDNGFPSSINQIYKHIQASEGLLISVNEHNGNPSAFFKNVIDWLSRLDRKFLEGKKIFLLSTSNGARGGIGSLEVTKNMLPRFGAEIVDTYSFPSFKENFSIEETKIINDKIKNEILEKLHQFEIALK